MDNNSEEAKSVRKDFLHAMFADYLDMYDGYIETREIFRNGSIEPKFHKNIDSVINYRSAANLYVGMCPREIFGNGRLESIKYLVGLWSDVDYGEVGHKKKPKHKTMEEALAAIAAFSLMPSIIVSSGHGVYPIWLLKEPLEINDPAYVKRILKAIEVTVGGDSVSDLPRILRLPGTKNYKIPDDVKKVEILRLEPSQRYCLDDFERTLPLQAGSVEKLLRRGKGEPGSSEAFSQAGQENTQKPENDSDERDSGTFKIDDLKIPKSVKHLIRVGKTDADYFDSRSEADFYVLCALVKAGLMDADIRTIFKEYAIGEKYREQGDAYLDHSIKTARSKVAAGAAGQAGATFTDDELSDIKARIQAIRSDMDRTELPGALDPILKEIAGHNIAQGDAILRQVIKDHFGLKADELKSYEKVLNGYRKKDKQAETPASFSQEGLLEMIRNGRDRKLVHPAQDYVDGKMVFAVRADQTPCIVTSDRKIFTFIDAKEKGLILKHDETDVCRFSSEGLGAFLAGEREVKAAVLYKVIYDYVKRFIRFPADAYLQYVVLWVIGTYVFMLFRYYPYGWIRAQKRSGKTLLMEVLVAIAFNGELITRPTEAVLYRDIENNLTTMFIDEFEQLGKQDQNAFAALQSILNVGFSKSGTVKRCESTGRGAIVVRKYSAYSPKIFAGISDIDDVLQDRTVRIQLLRKKDGEKTEKYRNSRKIQDLQRRIRDDLYIFALTYAGKLSALYENEAGDAIKGLGHLNNRELDIWEPIILLANQIDAEDPTLKLTEKMMAFSEMSMEEKHSDSLEENDAYKALTVFKEMLDEISPIRVNGDIHVFHANIVFPYFQKSTAFSWLLKPNSLSKRLKAIDVKRDQIVVKGTKEPVYLVDIKRFGDLWERYAKTEGGDGGTGF